jgi:hypothetical protein
MAFMRHAYATQLLGDLTAALRQQELCSNQSQAARTTLDRMHTYYAFTQCTL